ncbi:uncharacterized protein L969DRAFT_93775 [Mixia osmundae IAM 14324]|uniref:RNA cytidine acetyltransferase n=1 Tax=Mixia osmundae (strain CBS 9802 / IAM 14324 / JCM 22182 / KY 12970) TaxID=764103 RepID=G7E9J3_MIXOS|nr:uncharacterized protein L969DRAFT_93775 [Mixia osmundae IAM 14324]KEI39944.1 hypothetical protein L969DRAFT_93775 [Mixia osmundae IAM 14324]GAA99312.1 hypothetical protein E5Q_06007 [Mixia osmundae IAM 14324]
MATASGSKQQQQRKPLDNRIPYLISNGVQTQHRSFFVMVGSQKQAHQQIVNLHWLLSESRMSSTAPTTSAGRHAKGKAASRPNVLWCYSKELGFSSNRKKRAEKIKRDIARNVRDQDDMDPFELFVGATDIRYCYYKDTEKILGQTYGMLVLQDFEAITPNLLARTIETVEGGGLVVLILQGMKSLKQLYAMTMDVHSRYRTETSDAPIARFNERFILSLGSCSTCLILDDELNVLPISDAKDIVPLEKASAKGKSPAKTELDELKDSLKETQPAGSVIAEARTIDQARAILTFTEAIASKTLSSTVSLTAARGRGKSAALGLSIALAVAHSYSNIFVTSPSPENLKTLFEFIFIGFDKLGYQEHLDYDVVQSTNPDFKSAIVRVNVFRDHRQTIQYIRPQDAHALGQAELVVIDEAAAIPLPLVRKLIGPYLVFLSSTINGYEGTGRSLSLKLIQQLREASSATASSLLKAAERENTKKGVTATATPAVTISRVLKEVKLEDPIRYGQGDLVERWLNTLLCLDATIAPSKGMQGCPLPAQCDLLYVNRDTLFSYHPASELFLQRMMALYVASHYKNSPNDLQLMSDAPQHHLFVLLPPLKEDDNTLPEPLVVIQVALEGSIGKRSILDGLQRGIRPSGDLIPWTISQQFQDDDFGTMSGARIVRIATHPDYAKMGYGTRALQALDAFYSGQLLNLSEALEDMQIETFESAAKPSKQDTLHTEVIAVRNAARMPPLLQRLPERQPEKLDYLGVSYGLTPSLFKYWKRNGYIPMYLRQTENDLTGEHTCIMLRGLSSSRSESAGWLSAFALDFRRRFLSLLSFKFREFSSVLSLSIIEGANAGAIQQASHLTAADVRELFTPHDQKRLTSYANNMLDYHVILDLLPSLATLFFAGRFGPDITLSGVQRSILLSLGLQRKSIEDVERDLDLPVTQCLALFVKCMRKLSKALDDIQKHQIEATLNEELPSASQANGRLAFEPVKQDLAEELNDEGNEVVRQLRDEQREVINSLDLSKYAIAGEESDWQQAEARAAQLKNASGAQSVFSIRNPASTKRKSADKQTPQTNGTEKKRKKSGKRQ